MTRRSSRASWGSSTTSASRRAPRRPGSSPMAAASPYVAQVRLKWDDGFIQPGEPVPAGTGRNYQLMLAQGEITFVGHGGAVAAPQADGLPHSGSQAREQSERH